MSHTSYDFIVIGGGISGVAAAYELTPHGSVLLVERESQLAYHTTGRSAAISMESYGNAIIRALTVWSTRFLKNVELEFSETPLWAQRGALILADSNSETQLDRRIAAIQKLVPSVAKVDEQQLLSLAPYLRQGRWAGGLYEPDAFDLDVHAIHSAYLAGFRRLGGRVMRDSELMSAQFKHGGWQVDLGKSGTFTTGCLINAAGAWADVVAQRCGVATCGIRPLQRTVIMVDPQEDLRHTPYVGTVDEQLFIKPETTGILVSPCDEVPGEPGDVAPDEMDIAITMDRLLEMTRFSGAKIKTKWAGQRSFMPDRSPVIGADPQNSRFIWFAAVGGYGIQAGPAMARLVAASAIGQKLPKDICGDAFTEFDISPARYQLTAKIHEELNAVAELC